jgi:hypothetical protein
MEVEEKERMGQVTCSRFWMKSVMGSPLCRADRPINLATNGVTVAQGPLITAGSRAVYAVIYIALIKYNNS